MKLKEVLLNGLSFKEILKQFSINQFTIKDEETILSNSELSKKEIVKEKILIEGKSENGPLVNLFGTLHYNIINQLAVFELDFAEKTNLQAAS